MNTAEQQNQFYETKLNATLDNIPVRLNDQPEMDKMALFEKGDTSVLTDRNGNAMTLNESPDPYKRG